MHDKLSVQRVRTFPELILREIAAAVVSLAVLTVISTLWDATTGPPLNELEHGDEVVRAPWIFVGIQQLLRYLPPLIGGVGVPCLVILSWILIPFLSREATPSGQYLFIFSGACVIAFTAWGLLS